MKHALLVVVIVVLSVASCVVAQDKPATEKPSWVDNININGYFQSRYVHQDWAVDGFTFRQMYINLFATPNDRTKGLVQWVRFGADPNATSPTDWGDVWVEYKVSDTLTTRIGQSNNHFGLEMPQSSSKRMALERAAVLQGGGARPRGLYFGGLWDRGVWLTYTPQTGKWDPKVTLGVMNGQFRGSDLDSNKNVLVKLHWDRDWGQFGVTRLDGKWTNNLSIPGIPDITDRSAVVGYARWAPQDCRWAAQGEYVDGQLLGNDIDGWYAQAEYRARPGGTAFVKYDTYDPMKGTPNSDWDAWHIGYTQWLDNNNELTLQYMSGKNRADTSDPSRDELAFQWQLGFR